MKFYIATSLSRAPEHNALRDDLQIRGWQLTYDWSTHGSVKQSSVTRLQEIAYNEFSGIMLADVVVVLLPGGRGTHVELGMALAANKRVILHSNDSSIFEANDSTCAFYHHPTAEQIVCALDKLVENLEAEKLMTLF